MCSDSQPFKAVAVCLDGMKLFVPERAGAEANDKLFDRTVHKGEWPIDTVGSLMPFAHGEVMLDIGANIGTTSFPRAIFGAFRHIHAFEPEPRNFACLARGIEANGLGDRITAWPLAVAAQSGEIGFRVRRGIGRHHVTKAKKAEVTVKVTTLDDWMAREGIDPESIDFVKVDTQGYEMFVLGGAKRLLEARRAVWQLELSPSYMRAAGADMDALQTLLALHFSRFLDLRNPARQLQPMAAIGDTIAALERGHTDIITLP